jgi:hypothetical protein
MFFLISPIDYERQLKEEIWGCFKYIGLPMETIMALPIQDRKFYIVKHNEAMQAEEKRMKSAEKGNSHDSTISGEAVNSYAYREIQNNKHGSKMMN